MYSYFLRRLLLAIPTLIGITLVTFILVKSVPGDPVYGMVGERADEKTIEAVRDRLGLNEPFVVEYGKYLSLICQGNLGRSYYTRRPVGRTIIEKFPNTLRLAGAAMILAITLGTLLGIASAVRRDTLVDKVCTVVAAVGISTPVFWLALLLILVFAYWLGWFPASGMGPDGLSGGALAYIVLPAIALGTRSASYIARITRSAMLEVFSCDYLVAARAKGVSRRTLVLKHAFRNALIPVVTLVGMDFGSYLNGSVLTETIFGWDGIGRYAMMGIMKRDYPIILGTVLFGAAVFVLINLLVDISYSYLDPRIEYNRGPTES